MLHWVNEAFLMRIVNFSLHGTMITAADRQWNAEKFELTVFPQSKFVIGVSSQGLLLAFGRGTDGKPRSGKAMTLVSFQQGQNSKCVDNLLFIHLGFGPT
jgi:hypothetical protein